MRVDLDGLKVEILGDPHLGRRFVRGVPLHRRGEREGMVWASFMASLQQAEGAHVHICMGDLFDKSYVDYTVIDRAVEGYRWAAEAFPETQFIILQGNHDIFKDMDRRSAFDIFKRCFGDLENVIIADRPMFHLTNGAGYENLYGLALVPWHPVFTAGEQTEMALGGIAKNPTAVFGHFDVDPIAGTHNLVPIELLKKFEVKKVFTGHVHKSETFVRDGVEVIVTGSMQPYAHGEEVDNQLYITLSKLEADHIREEVTRDRCVRVVLEPGEIFDRELDCLQLTIKRLNEKGEEIPEIDVDLGDFNIDNLMAESLQELGIDRSIASALTTKFQEMRLA